VAFDPASLYSLAHLLRLQSKGDDAQLRSCISRAYYGAFIVARDAAKVPSYGQNGHETVINHYLAGSPNEKTIGDALKKLKKLRVHADYKPTAPCAASQGMDAMSLSAKVLRALGSLPAQAINAGAPPPSATP